MDEVEEINTRYGVLQVPNARSDIIGRHLSRFGEWAWIEVLFTSSLIPSAGARVLDGGAFLGTFGLGLASVNSIDYIHFVEANSEVIELLRNNVGLNCRAKWAVENVLLAPQDVVVGEARSDKDNLGSTSFAAAGDSDHAQGILKTQTLRQIEERVGNFDLVKLDLEGGEVRLIEADREYLSSRDLSLWVECNESQQSFQLAELLLSLGRSVYYFAFPAYNPDNVNGSGEPIFPWAYEAGLLATKHRISSLSLDLIRYDCILKEVSSVADLKAALWRTPRWGLDEWLGLSLPEVVAVAAHRLHGDDINNFPEDNPAPRLLIDDQLRAARSELAVVKGKLDTMMQESGGTAQNVIAARESEKKCQHALELATARISELERNVAQSAAQALDRLAQIGEVRRAADEQLAAMREGERVVIDTQGAAIQRLEQENAELRVRLGGLQAIEASTYWRAGASVRRIATKYPVARRFLASTRRALAKITRPFR
ncbi:TPA: FkbM family methyltransferase [Burkholderia vietnamiensis]|uniref:FkbM family methyltransferase n=1 Tax=Burkholderia vietnamiensis TaxID=60552 RepID=A0AAW7T073_BURVI|nr:FkbM family methyltransferase [Burkholderia vietnamiensis]MBR7913409.1 FkbM family methyltransferase [Burkholderia vietnamiensis]MBR8358469.1 FkbM family methyltransferase [Burkholderia vietnamiensis]MDN7795590.1 FkbM family methyltransferase [Burkholderia vietnamiensis]CAG9213461.1 Methyltransferase, FkbM family [Burkholderia vietnamiensis]HDR9190704.1 FkbM family methyltransferase [Burkholderia vietnamiensis]